MKKLELTTTNHHGRNVKQRIQKIIDDYEICRKKINSADKTAPRMTWNTAKKLYKEFEDAELYVNDTYQVLFYNEKMVDDMEYSYEEFRGKIRYLSIKRHDKEAIQDWRDLQDIKNQICGEDSEAIQLHPNEKRLVDTSNQYHLWVFPKNYLIPLGFNARVVIDEEMRGEGETAKQRARID